MLTEKDAKDLIVLHAKLKQQAEESKDKLSIKKYKDHQNLCIEKFQYIISMKTYKYKHFQNYDDLKQEAFVALIRAMETYKPNKGSAFWWIHKYVDTRISRSASLHTAIRYPLKKAKELVPHKELVIPDQFSDDTADANLDNEETIQIISNGLKLLSDKQKNVIKCIYGIDESEPLSINQTSKKLNMLRTQVIKNLETGMNVLKDKIFI